MNNAIEVAKMDKCSKRNTGKGKLSQMGVVWVEHREIKDDLDMACYLGKKTLEKYRN